MWSVRECSPAIFPYCLATLVLHQRQHTFSISMVVSRKCNLLYVLLICGKISVGL